MVLESFDIVVVGAVGVDTNVFLKTDEIDFTIESNFTENIDYVGQAGGYFSRLFSQLGYHTAIIGYIGDDFLGTFVKNQLISDKINTDGLFIDLNGTKRSINIVYPDGRRKNYYDGKGSMSVVPDIEKCEKILKNTKIAHFSIVNWSRYLLPIAKNLGLIISVDIQDMIHMDDPYRKEYIKYADLLFFSDVNIPDSEKIVKVLLKKKPNRIIIVGRGSKGILCGLGDEITKYPVVNNKDPVIDTNGAGDALAVGFISSFFLKGMSIEQSIFQAQTLARHICTKKASTSNLIKKSLNFLIYKE